MSGRTAARREHGGDGEGERRRAEAQPKAGAAGKGKRDESERGTRSGENPDDGASHRGGGQAGGGERREPPGKGTAQRAQRVEARGIPARRDETGKRARQGSPVAKRRARIRNKKRRHRSDGQQHHRNKVEIIALAQVKEPEDRMQREARRSGGAAAGGGAEGDAPREGWRVSGAMTK